MVRTGSIPRQRMIWRCGSESQPRSPCTRLASTRMTNFAPHGGNRLDPRHALGHSMGIRTHQDHGDCDATSVREEMKVAAGFGSIRGIRACSFPPCTARTEALSTTARDQSTWSPPCRLAWSSSCSAVASRSCPCRSSSRGAGTPTECPSGIQREFRSGPAGCQSACDSESENASVVEQAAEVLPISRDRRPVTASPSEHLHPL